jgi:hypothetical protein
MKKDKFQEAVRLNNEKSYLLNLKEIVDRGAIDIRTFPGVITVKGTLLKKIEKVIDEEIREVDQKIENLLKKSN